MHPIMGGGNVYTWHDHMYVPLEEKKCIFY
jgi:hypothetical protein